VSGYSRAKRIIDREMLRIAGEDAEIPLSDHWNNILANQTQTLPIATTMRQALALQSPGNRH